MPVYVLWSNYSIYIQSSRPRGPMHHATSPSVTPEVTQIRCLLRGAAGAVGVMNVSTFVPEEAEAPAAEAWDDDLEEEDEAPQAPTSLLDMSLEELAAVAKQSRAAHSAPE